MKQFLPIAFLVVFLVTLALGIFYYYSATIVPIKFNSKHPNIAIAKTESLLFNLYANTYVNPQIKVIGIIFTEKQRTDNSAVRDGYQTFGSTLDIINPGELVIYIWVSDNILMEEKAERKILEYTINTIQYYQEVKQQKQLKWLLDLIKIPFYVKTN